MTTILMIIATALVVISQYADVSTTNHPSTAPEANSTGVPQWFMKHFGRGWWIMKVIFCVPLVIGAWWFASHGGFWPYASALALTLFSLAFVPAIVENMRLNGQIAKDAYSWIPKSILP